MNWLEVSPGSRRLPPARPRASSVSGRPAAPSGFDARALRAQRLQQEAERPAPQLRRRVEPVGALAGRGGGQEEPGRSARLGAEDVGLRRRERPAGAVDGQSSPRRSTATPRLRRPAANAFVSSGVQGAAQYRPAGREAGEQQRAIGHALGARHAHARVEAGPGGADGCGGCWRGLRSSPA